MARKDSWKRESRRGTPELSRNLELSISLDLVTVIVSSA